VRERKTLCDLETVAVDFGGRPANTFQLTLRHRNGQQTGRIEVDQVEAELPPG